ncbi:unnamed protein product [Linum trigynum]|uniref:Uncharacterized protein n=1 Tax=Linum trigynum TaxID=586398 RepID=A0AAV2DFK7_9ROSI
MNCLVVSNSRNLAGLLDVHGLWSMFTVLGDRELPCAAVNCGCCVHIVTSDFSSVFALFDLQISQNSSSTLPHVLGPEMYQNKYNLA